MPQPGDQKDLGEDLRVAVVLEEAVSGAEDSEDSEVVAQVVAEPGAHGKPGLGR
jgi:hypothetical protein